MIARTSPLNWRLRTFWTKSSWAASSSMLAAIAFAEGELRQPEQIIPSIVITDDALRFCRDCVTVRRTEATTPELTSSMLGNCDWEGCVIAAATNSAKSGWAISDPASSKIMTVPFCPGRWAWTKSLKVSSLRSAASTPGTFPRNGRADRDHRRANAEGEIGRRDIRTVRSHRLPVPGALAGVVSVLPQIDFTDLVVLLDPERSAASAGRPPGSDEPG